MNAAAREERPPTRLLLVDDEAPLRLTLGATLELEGFEVHEAPDAESALDLATKTEFDVVLTDIRMPGMSGVELFYALRKQRVKAPVVLMTAFAQEDQVLAALEDGAFAILSKPFDMQHAVDTVTMAAKVPVVLVVEAPGPVVEGLSRAGLRVRSIGANDDLGAALADGDVDVGVLAFKGDTIDLGRRLRERGVVIIGVASSETPELVRALAAMGVHAFFKDPVDERALVRAIAIARGANESARAKLLART